MINDTNETTDVALSVKNISKTFRLPHERHSGLKNALISIAGGKHKRGYEPQKVLDDISFDIKKGEFFGIVGRNGSGKSTLLKLMAGIYVPDSGKIIVNGSLTPFIELGVGFNPELTGYENVFLNGALLGFSRKEMEAKYDDIVSFAELEDFMDQKLKNYSSGMQVRLAFAIAIQSDSDILILDEVLAVGDEAFQRKCNDYFTRIKQDPSKTVVLVTHSMDSVKRYCDRAMMIHEGEVVSIGAPADVASEYNLENLNQLFDDNEESEDVEADPIVKDLRVKMLNQQQISQDDQVQIEVRYTAVKECETNVLVYLNDANKNCYLIGGRSKNRLHKEGETIVERVTFSLAQMNNATVIVGTEVWQGGEIVAYIPHDKSPMFMLARTDYGEMKENKSILFGHGVWEDDQL